jgi:hypothetical protein
MDYLFDNKFMKSYNMVMFNLFRIFKQLKVDLEGLLNLRGKPNFHQ